MPDFERRSSASFISSKLGGTPSHCTRAWMKPSKSNCFLVSTIHPSENMRFFLFYACSRFVSTDLWLMERPQAFFFSQISRGRRGKSFDFQRWGQSPRFTTRGIASPRQPFWADLPQGGSSGRWHWPEPTKARCPGAVRG